MNRIFVTSDGPDDWKRFLADPEKQWRTGFSAKSLAYCWESVDGFPREVACLFAESNISVFRDIEPLIILPEYQVSLPGGSRPSQNDIFVLAKAQGQLISITVEGKVSESFGPTLGEWNPKSSKGKMRRLEYLKEQLGLSLALPPSTRYQLLHRAASAVIEAHRFTAKHAVMLVHSFSQSIEWFEDFLAFIGLFGSVAEPDQLVFVNRIQSIDLYCGWVKGDIWYLEM